ncbi:MAG: hypothetical protein IT495_07100, partial [Gammaproteobacteria bacterium]|nr:hypothetical protein [Gammaproteobacteria bacterium]
TVVENHYGAGRAIYSAADLEAGNSTAHDSLFLALVTSLLDGPAAFGSDAHPVVWMNVFDQPEHGRRIVSLFNNAPTDPPLPVPEFSFRLRPPAGRHYTRLVQLPQDQAVPFARDPDGTIRAAVSGLEALAMYAAYHQ